MVPTRHIADQWQPQPPRRDEERRDLFHLKIAQDDCRAFSAQPFEEFVRDVTATREIPALHRALENPPPREWSDAGRIEQRVWVPRTHPLHMKAVAVVEADREGVVADSAIQRPIGAAEQSF